MGHTYTVVIKAEILVTVYDAESAEEAIPIAQEMAEQMQAENDFNRGTAFVAVDLDHIIRAEHDSQCLKDEEDE